MGYKERKLWEDKRKQALSIDSCKFCSRWGSTPDDVLVDTDTPVACELVTSEEIYQYETALNLPPWNVVTHRIHTLLNPGSPCGVDCQEPKPRNMSGFGGLSKYERIKMAVKIEDLASQLTDLTGNKTLTGACPFHGGSGKELVIWTDIEEWKCYGKCQIGGDVIHFIQECYKRGMQWVLPNVTSELTK